MKKILAITISLMFPITALAAPIDECSRPVLWKTLIGKCNEAKALSKSISKAEKPSRPSRPEKPSKPSKPEKPDRDKPSRDKGNASANNGKGGNYDRTGHSDNGKGKGRDKK